MSGERIDLLAEIHRLQEENKELKRVNKLKHELYQEQKERADRIDKGLNKACDVLEDLSRFTLKGSIIRTKEEWKEWCLEDE